jgi:hypothetical protein
MDNEFYADVYAMDECIGSFTMTFATDDGQVNGLSIGGVRLGKDVALAILEEIYQSTKTLPSDPAH